MMITTSMLFPVLQWSHNVASEITYLWCLYHILNLSKNNRLINNQTASIIQLKCFISISCDQHNISPAY